MKKDDQNSGAVIIGCALALCVLILAASWLFGGCSSGRIIQTDDIYDDAGEKIIGQQRIEIYKRTPPFFKDVTLHEVEIEQASDGYRIRAGQRIDTETQEGLWNIINGLIEKIPGQ